MNNFVDYLSEKTIGMLGLPRWTIILGVFLASFRFGLIEEVVDLTGIIILLYLHYRYVKNKRSVKSANSSNSVSVNAQSKEVAKSGSIMKLPRFFDVEGVPVKFERAASGGMAVLAFDSVPPRRFPIDSVYRNGSEITENEFNRLLSIKRT